MFIDLEFPSSNMSIAPFIFEHREPEGRMILNQAELSLKYSSVSGTLEPHLSYFLPHFTSFSPQ